MSIRILLIDNDSEGVVPFKYGLEALNFEVNCAFNGISAIDSFAVQSYDLVVIEWDSLFSSGAEVITTLDSMMKAQTPKADISTIYLIHSNIEFQSLDIPTTSLIKFAGYINKSSPLDEKIKFILKQAVRFNEKKGERKISKASAA